MRRSRAGTTAISDLFHQSGQHLERHARGDGAGGVGIETADEHGQAPEGGLLDGVEKVVASLDRGPNVVVLRAHVAAARPVHRCGH